MIETNRVEYKEILTDGLEKEVVAFLNYREDDGIRGSSGVAVDLALDRHTALDALPSDVAVDLALNLKG